MSFSTCPLLLLPLCPSIAGSVYFPFLKLTSLRHTNTTASAASNHTKAVDNNYIYRSVSTIEGDDSENEYEPQARGSIQFRGSPPPRSHRAARMKSFRNIYEILAVSPEHRVIAVFAVSLLATFTCGSQYSISAWTPHLKRELNATQGDIEIVGELGNLGAYLGPLTGAIVYALPEMWVSLISAVCTVIGFLPMALAILHGPADSGFWANMRTTKTLGGFFFITGFGSATLYNLILTANIYNMLPHRRGVAVSVIATLFGLSASVYTLIYNHVLGGNVGHFLLFLCVLVSSASVLSAIFIRKVDRLGGAKVDPNATGIISADSASHYHAHVDVDEQQQQQHQQEEAESPTAAVSSKELGEEESGSQHLLMDTLSTNSPSPLPVTSRTGLISSSSGLRPSTSITLLGGDSLANDEADDESHRNQILNEEHEQMALQARLWGGGLWGHVFGAFLHLAKSMTFWLLTCVFFIIVGSGLMMINNLGHMVQSLNDGVADTDFTTLLILLLSIANGAGRLIMAGTDFVRWKKGMWLVGVCCMMTLSHALNAFALQTKDSLIVGVLGVGVAYGGAWAIMPIIVRDNFGQANFSMNFGWVGSVSGVSTVLFNYFAGKFYDDETPAGSTQCVGSICFQNSFVLCMVASCVAVILSIVLVPRTVRGKNKQPSSKN